MLMLALTLGVVVIFAAGAAWAAGAADLVAKADELYKQRVDMAKAKEALALYEQAFAQDPSGQNAALWPSAPTGSASTSRTTMPRRPCSSGASRPARRR